MSEVRVDLGTESGSVLLEPNKFRNSNLQCGVQKSFVVVSYLYLIDVLRIYAVGDAIND